MFVLCLRTNMYAYVYPSVHVYLSTSSVRVSMLAIVCVHARVREGVCVSPSVCLSVRPRACSCIKMFDRKCVRASMHAFVCLHARVREGVCVSLFVRPSIRPSVRLLVCLCLSVRPSVCLSVRVHVRASKCLLVHACVHQCLRDISYF